MKIQFKFIWYDLYIGPYWSRKDKKLYFAILPTLVFIFNFDFSKEAHYECSYCRKEFRSTEVYKKGPWFCSYTHASRYMGNQQSSGKILIKDNIINL